MADNMKILEKILQIINFLSEKDYKVKFADKVKGVYRIDIKRHKDDFWQSEEYKECERILGDDYIEGTYGSDTYTLWIKAVDEPKACKLCYFYENDCPKIRGKFVPYPSIVCKDYKSRD